MKQFNGTFVFIRRRHIDGFVYNDVTLYGLFLFGECSFFAHKT